MLKQRTTNRCQTMTSQSFGKLYVPRYYAKRVISLGIYIPFSKCDLLFLITQFLISEQCYWVYTKCHKKWIFSWQKCPYFICFESKILLKNIPLLPCHNVCWIKPQHACFPLVPKITQTNLDQKELLSRLTKLVFPSYLPTSCCRTWVIQQRNLHKEGIWLK